MLMCITNLILIYTGLLLTCIYNIYLSYAIKNNRNEYIDMSHENVVNVVVI